jgi:hypothetical protein
VSATVGYFEAWGQWFSGQQVSSDARLWFMSVRWWERAGKIAAFLGGATVVLDLIGPERLRTWVADKERLRSRASDWLVVGPITFCVVLTILDVLVIVDAIDIIPNSGVAWAFAVSPVVALIVFPLFEGLAALLTRLTIRTLDAPRPAQALRYFGLVLLVVGFHFDLLAS